MHNASSVLTPAVNGPERRRSRRKIALGDLTQTRRPRRIAAVCGGVAQLGERRVRNAEVEGSIPFLSTTRPVFQTRDDCCININPAFFVTGVM